MTFTGFKRAVLLVTDKVLAPVLRVPATPIPIPTETRSYGLVLSVLTKITVPQTLAQPNQLVPVLRPRQVVTVTWVTAQHGLAALPALAELTLVLITA